MSRRPPLLLAPASLPMLSGCVAQALYGVATAPVRIVSKAADLATTSQSEADETRGRAVRRREENLGKLERTYQRHSRECADGDRSACARARDEYAQMQAIMPTVPYEPR